MPDAISSSELREVAEADAALISIIEDIRAVPRAERHLALVAWARSDWWHPALMVLDGWHGAIARSAWRALKLDLEADSPARAWDRVDYAIGRASIIRLLGLGGDRCAFYASAAFKAFVDDEGSDCIAGAVGAPPLLHAERLSRWTHLDIDHVILWNPRTGQGKLAGEHADTSSLTLPVDQGSSLTVFTDCAAFFRAWATMRAQAAHRASWSTMPGEWAHPVSEPRDGGLPGALVLGPPESLRWRGVTASTVIAGPGASPAMLRSAALRAARLPGFVESGDAHG